MPHRPRTILCAVLKGEKAEAWDYENEGRVYARHLIAYGLSLGE
jgi:hypothetical protein